MDALYDSFRDAADDYEQVMKQLEDENSKVRKRKGRNLTKVG